ncbi:MAG: hypothetical protein H6728_00100 [Myxococcales bacterium]|nr:hypothetical protein [Myxococcales bacterium]MCB9641463.1 hypothetical protein [Myxococcales bacterium]
MNIKWFALGLAVLLFNPACGPDNRIQTTALQQSACLSNQAPEPNKEPPNPYTTQPEVTLSKGTVTLNVSYKNVRFRCGQDATIEAFLDEGGIVRVVAHPKDMNPSIVAGCDCLYDLGAQVGPLPAGKYKVKIQRQTDNYGGSSETDDLRTEEVELTGAQ